MDACLIRSRITQEIDPLVVVEARPTNNETDSTLLLISENPMQRKLSFALGILLVGIA